MTASVLLSKPDIALVSDVEGTRVEIDHLVAADRSRARDEALVTFDGDTYPTAYRGTHRSRTIACTARFVYTEHANLLAFLALLESADTAADGRLMLRTNRGLVAGLDAIEVVTVPAWSEAHLRGMAYDVSFTATRVAHDVEV